MRCSAPGWLSRAVRPGANARQTSSGSDSYGGVPLLHRERSKRGTAPFLKKGYDPFYFVASAIVRSSARSVPSHELVVSKLSFRAWVLAPRPPPAISIEGMPRLVG